MNKQAKNKRILNAGRLFAVPWRPICIITNAANTTVTRRSNSEQYRVIAKANSQLIKGHDTGTGEGGILALIFAGCVPLAS